MTKTEAVAQFREHILPLVRKNFGKNDHTAMRIAWNDYTDNLCKERKITSQQYDSWSNPFEKGG